MIPLVMGNLEGPSLVKIWISGYGDNLWKLYRRVENWRVRKQNDSSQDFNLLPRSISKVWVVVCFVSCLIDFSQHLFYICNILCMHLSLYLLFNDKLFLAYL